MNNTTQLPNTLLPVFMKLEQMKVLLVGAGHVALEKLKTIKHNAPQTHICVVAKEVNQQFADYASLCEHVELIQDHYADHYLRNIDVVFSAVNDPALSAQIFADAQKEGKLCNSADKPELCHFYLGSVVTKGDLKIAISTNGKSPTMAKRLKEVLQNALPNQLNDLVQNLHIIRNRMDGNFEQKVQRLNELTRILVEKEAIFIISSQESTERGAAAIENRDEGIAPAISEERFSIDALRSRPIPDEIMKIAEKETDG